MAVSADMVKGVKEFLEVKCAGTAYQPESIDVLAAEVDLTKEEFVEARSNLLAVNELFITRGPRTKYSLIPFPATAGRVPSKSSGIIDMDSLSNLKDSLDKVNIGQFVKEYQRLKALEECLGKPSVVKSGNMIVKTYTVVEER